MQGLAEVEGNTSGVREARRKLDRDVVPLQRELSRHLDESRRQELMYQAPDIEASSDMQALINSSDDLLRESQSILAETEHIGNTTLQQMGRQREQLQSANANIEAVKRVAAEAKKMLVSLSRAALFSKLGLYATIAVLSLANLYVLVLIYKRHHEKSDD